MAFSMNWRPELDDIQQSTPSSSKVASSPPPSRPLGPIPGILPPRPSPGSVKPSSSSTRNGSSSGGYSMSWRPPSPEPASEPAEQSAPLAAASGHSQQRLADGSRVFRISRAEGALPVQCYNSTAYSCSTQDGMVCTLERQEATGPLRARQGDEAPWLVGLHPAQPALTSAEELSMARALYACCYAAFAKNESAKYMVLELASGESPSASVRKALAHVGLFPGKLMVIAPAHLLQLYSVLSDSSASTAQSLFPYIPTSSFTGKVPVTHPLGQPVTFVGPRRVYTRFVPAVDAYIEIHARSEDRGSSALLADVAVCAATGPDSERTQNSLSAAVGWAPEYAHLPAQANDVDDYDRVIHLLDDEASNGFSEPRAETATSASTGATAKAHQLFALAHYLLLHDPRTRCIWVLATKDTSSSETLEERLDIVGGKEWLSEARTSGPGLACWKVDRSAFWTKVVRV